MEKQRKEIADQEEARRKAEEDKLGSNGDDDALSVDLMDDMRTSQGDSTPPRSGNALKKQRSGGGNARPTAVVPANGTPSSKRGARKDTGGGEDGTLALFLRQAGLSPNAPSFVPPGQLVVAPTEQDPEGQLVETPGDGDGEERRVVTEVGKGNGEVAVGSPEEEGKDGDEVVEVPGNERPSKEELESLRKNGQNVGKGATPAKAAGRIVYVEGTLHLGRLTARLTLWL